MLGEVAPGSAEFGDRCSSLVVVVVDSWLGELSCGTLGGQVKETVKFAGTLLFVECALVKRRRSACLTLCTKSTNLAVLRFWSDDDDGGSCHTTSARGFHFESSSC